jgi:glucokinase
MHPGDTVSNLCIAVTGLPGSGKTTIGREIANSLNLAFLDKDDYLERLFDERGVGDSNWRQNLSRESDLIFQRDAENESAVVLVSHWRPDHGTSKSGTPTEWLAKKFSRIIELYCICPTEEAAKRFINRKRHPGHLDEIKKPDEITEWLIEYEKYLPLSLGTLAPVETCLEEPLDILIARINEMVQSHA